MVDIIALENTECATHSLKKGRKYQLEEHIAAPLEIEGRIRVLRNVERTADDRLADAEQRVAALETELTATKAEQAKLAKQVAESNADVKTDAKEATTTKAKK